MKTILRLLSLLLFASVFLVACGGSSSGSPDTPSPRPTPTPTPTPSPTPTSTATVLVYIEGTNLEAPENAAKKNITEMLAAASSANVRIVLATGAADKAVSGDDVDNWRRVRRYAVENNKLVLKDDSLGAIDMGTPKALTDFITWGQTNYSADKYVLVFWDHGGGTVGGFGGYDTRKKATDPKPAFYASTLSVQQLKDAVDAAVANRPERRFELIGFDACLMATLEVATAFKDSARYLAASQEIEPGAGWNWTSFLNHLVSNPGADGASIGSAIADSYQNKMNDAKTGAIITLSVTDLAKVPRINNALAAFSSKYSGLLAGGTGLNAWNDLASKRSRALDFTDWLEMVDLVSMFDSNPLMNTEPLLQSEVTELANATKDAVVKKVAGPNRSQASGLSVMFPSYSLWNTDKGPLKTYDSFTFLVPEYKALVNGFSAYARNSVNDTTFGTAALSGGDRIMSAKINSPKPVYEQVYVALHQAISYDDPIKRVTVTEDAYVALQPVYSTSGDASEFSFASDSKWFMLDGKLASVIAAPTTEKGVQTIKIPMQVERAGWPNRIGMYYLLYNFDSDTLVETIGFIANANNQVDPADELRKDDLVYLQYFVMPADSTAVVGSWSTMNRDDSKFTVGANPPVFVKAAIPTGNDYAFIGFDLRWKQFVSNSVKLH